MSNWQPISGKGNELRRELRCYGKPTVIARVSRLVSLDGFDYVAMAACTAGYHGSLLCSAKAKNVVEAKVVANALGKHVRQMAMRKARKDSRHATRNGSIELALVNVEKGGGK